MLTQKISKTFDIGDGREVTIETGRLARQADGSVTVKMGNSIILATVVATDEPKPGQDFFPLSVDYMEKFASAGRIPGSVIVFITAASYSSHSFHLLRTFSLSI